MSRKHEIRIITLLAILIAAPFVICSVLGLSGNV